MKMKQVESEWARTLLLLPSARWLAISTSAQCESEGEREKGETAIHSVTLHQVNKVSKRNKNGHRIINSTPHSSLDPLDALEVEAQGLEVLRLAWLHLERHGYGALSRIHLDDPTRGAVVVRAGRGVE